MLNVPLGWIQATIVKPLTMAGSPYCSDVKVRTILGPIAPLNISTMVSAPEGLGSFYSDKTYLFNNSLLNQDYSQTYLNQTSFEPMILFQFYWLMTQPHTPIINIGMLLKYQNIIIQLFNLMWILQSDWLIRLEKNLVIHVLDNLGWYYDVTKIFIWQRQIQRIPWNNRK